MKCVILGNTNLGYSWFVKTFKQGLQLNGHEVIEIDYRSTPLNVMYEKISLIKPKIMFTHLSFHPIYSQEKVFDVFHRIRNNFKTKIIHILGDARTEPRFAHDLSYAFDFAFINQTQNLEKFKNYWKIPTIFCPYSCITQDKISEFDKDFAFKNPVFTGGWNTHVDRKNFLHKLDKKLKIEKFQTQSKNDIRHKTSEVSASAQCILGFCTGYDIDGFIDVRPFQYMGAGAVMITRKFKGMDDIIPDNLYYFINGYEEQDLNDVVRIFNSEINGKDNSNLRKEAFEFMQQYHSSKRRLKDIVDVIQEKRDNVRSFLWD